MTKIFNSKVRKFVILQRLFDGEHLSYQRLSEDYFVSRSSIANDISDIKELLSDSNIQLKFDNSGSYIEKDEIAIQQAIKRIYFNFKNLDVRKIFIKQSLIEQVKKTLFTKKEQLKLLIPDFYLNDIVLTVSILIERSREGKKIPKLQSSNFDELWIVRNYPLANELIQSIEKNDIYSFSTNELNYLSSIVLSNDAEFFMKEDKIPNTVKKQVKELIADVGTSLKVSLVNDIRLQEDLETHIYQMFLRLRAHTTVINPLLKEIRKKYSRTYGVVWYFLNNLGNDNHFRISDDEVGFIAIHFQAALERAKINKKVLFICPNGVGTSSLALAQLREVLPANLIIETKSLLDLEKYDLSNVQLIISTIPLPKMLVPVIKISPILSENDMKSVMNKYIETSVTRNKLEKIKPENTDFKLLKNHILFTSSKNRKDIVFRLAEANVWKSNLEKKEYLNSVEKRENLQSTFLGNGFAIPHGDPQKLTHSAIAIAVLNKPIAWEDNKVDIICLLMIDEKDKDQVEPFMNLIMKGIKNKEWFIKQLKEVDE